MPAATATPRETAERFLRATIGADPGDMADCYAPNFVIEMPFAETAAGTVTMLPSIVAAHEPPDTPRMMAE